MGTPEFAVESLDKLFHSHHQVLAVVTSPDKPAGRGLKIKYSAVKEYALKNNLTCLQPEKLRDPNFTEILKKMGADVFVVIAFRMLPQSIWEIPPFGTINIHASLLPDYRGAAPINHAIMNGEKETGVSSFIIQKEIDTGDILLQKKCEILFDDNAGTLHDRLKTLGAELIVETLDGLEKGTIKKIPQTHFKASEKLAAKLNTENTRINFDSSAISIYNFCRGLNPYPGAWCTLKQGDSEIILKVFTVQIATSESKAGVINAEGLVVRCADGQVILTEIQPAGKRRMSAADFLRGIQDKKSPISIK